MFDFNDPNMLVQMCKFEGLIQKSHIVIKFPCSYFVEWKTINNRYSICTQKRVRTANDEAIFNEKLTFYTQMIFNTKKKQYYSKETFLVLNLVSKSRPDQVKLVGRISIDLADVLNRRRYAQITQMKLNYCSVEGSIVFKINLLNKRDSNLSVKDLDRSAFTDYFSLNPINRMVVGDTVPTNSSNEASERQQNFITFQSKQHGQNVTKGSQVQQKQQQKYIIIQKNDDEIISFQNSERYQQNAERQTNQSPGNESREQSLIERLEERNLRRLDQKQIKKEKRNHVETGNLVEPNKKQFPADRDSFEGQDQFTKQFPKNQKSKSRTQVLPKTQQEVQFGHQLRQIPSQKITTQQKQTSGGLYEQQQDAPSSRRSFTSQYRDEQLLSIVEKLEREKQEQESMIQQLKAMVMTKNMKKKETKGSAVADDMQKQNRIKQLQQQNEKLKRQIQKLQMNEEQRDRQLQTKYQEVRTRDNQIDELNQKVKKLQSDFNQVSEKIKRKQEEIAQLARKEEEYRLLYQEAVRKMNVSIVQEQKLINSIDSELESPVMFKKQSSKVVDIYNLSFKHSSSSSMINESLDRQNDTPQIKITITKDEKIYEQIERQNNQLLERVKQLEEENQIYKELLQEHNSSPVTCRNKLYNSKGSNDQVMVHNCEEETPFVITISKNNNIYENYENLQKQNDELYDRIKELEAQILSYQEIEKQKKQNLEGDLRNSVEISESAHEDVYTYPTQIQNRTNKNVEKQSPHISEQHMNLVAETFKIVVSRDKSIYEQQEEDNIYLSKRVIELEEQVETYKQLLEQQSHQQANKLKNSLQMQQHYENEGFTITLSQNKNVFENQEQQLGELYNHVKQLEETIKKYELCYGKIDSQPQYKVSITREENIYDQQEKEIHQLLNSLHFKDEQIHELTERLAKVHKELDFSNKAEGNFDGEIKISIKRDENIYDEQEREIKELSSKLIQLEDELFVLSKDNTKKSEELSKLNLQISQLKQQPKAFTTNTELKPNKQTELLKKQLQQLALELELTKQESRKNKEEEQKLKISEANSKQSEVKLRRQEEKSQQQKLKFKQQAEKSQQELQKSRQQLQKSRQELQKLKHELEQVKRQNSLKQMATSANATRAPLKCQICPSLQSRIQQLQLNLQLLQQQKSLLEQEIGTLEEEKFCLNSTENELKIRISEMEEELNLIKEENERLFEELDFLQQNYQPNPEGHPTPDQNIVYEEESIETFYNHQPEAQHYRDESYNYQQQQMHQMHQHGLLSHENTFHMEAHNNYQANTQVPHLQIPPNSKYYQQPQSPEFNNSHHTIALLQEQNNELRNSLSIFQQQLQEQEMTIGELQQRISGLMHEKKILIEKEQQMNDKLNAFFVLQRQFRSNENQHLKKIQELENKISHLHTNNNNLEAVLSSNRSTENLLTKKQQQIEHLEKQLHSLNQSLTELSFSYQSLQQIFTDLEREKNQKVQSIRQEHQQMNSLLKQELQSIQKVIAEKNKLCNENQQELRKRGEQIQQLFDEVNHLREQNDKLLADYDRLKQQNENMAAQYNLLRQQHGHLNVQNQRLKAIELEANIRQKKAVQQRHILIQMIESLKLTKKQKDDELTELLPYISAKLNQVGQFQENTDKNLAKQIAQEIQKIKISIMRSSNHFGVQSNGGVFQRSNQTIVNKSVEGNKQNEKSTMLNYLKPIEELIRGY